MLAIIGRRHSGSNYLGQASGDEDIMIVDFGVRDDIEEFLKIRPYGEVNTILVVENAWLGLDGRTPSSKVNMALTHIVLHYREYGFSNVILLTEKVSRIRKRVRDAADVKFDFAAQ